MPLPVNRFPNKLAPKVSYNIPRNRPSCSVASLLIVLITLFTNKPDSSSDLTIFIMSLISSLEFINAVCLAKSEGSVPDPNIFLWIAASTADADAVNPNGIKTLLASGLSTFFIKDDPVFSNGPKSLPKNPPDCTILCNWVFDNFILAEELLRKASRLAY